MGQNILPLVDFRTSAQREGVTKQQQTMESIGRILQTAGQIEKKRQERQQLDNITRAISQGATTAEAILAASQQDTQFGGGIAGVLQKISSRFQQPGGGVTGQIQSSMISDVLQKALNPPQQVPAGLEATGATQSATGQVTTRYEQPWDASQSYKPVTRSGISAAKIKAEKFLRPKNKNIAMRKWKAGKANYTQENILETYKQYMLDRDYENLNDTDRARLDKVWDETVAFYNKKPGKATKGEYDWDPASPEIVELRESSQTPKANMKARDKDRFGKAPHPDLEEHWGKILDDEKEEIKEALSLNPNNITEILRILNSG